MRIAPLAAAFSLVTAASALANADVVPLDECAMRGKKQGEACKAEDGRPGACTTITYTRTFRPPDPSMPPSTSQQSYFGCQAGATPTVAGGKGKGCELASAGAPSRGGPLALVALALAAWAGRRGARTSGPNKTA